jgi:hypothetical protein
MTFRFEKSELGCESPRLWQWETRLKLLLMVSLIYAFLLTLLEEQTQARACLALALLVSSYRKAVPPGCDTALPVALGHQSLMGNLCPFAACPQLLNSG